MEFSKALPLLKELHKERRLIVFAGSGVSKDSGLPLWTELVRQIIDFCDRLLDHLRERGTPSEVIADFADAIAISRKELNQHPVWITSVLKDQLSLLQRKGFINALELFNGQVMAQFIGKNPNPNHENIIKCNFPYIITSNYDNLFQLAAIDLNVRKLEFNVYDFTEPEKIASAIYLGDPAIIHIHGRANHAATRSGFEDLILSKNDYQRIKKDRPAMGQIIRTLFLKYNVLFVGFGVDDPHINDVVEEIAYFFPERSSDIKLPQYFVTWKRGPDTSDIQSKYARLNRTNFVYLSDYSDHDTLFGALQS